MEPLGRRKHRLMESLAVQQLFRDTEDEEAWIREKEPIVASNNRGRDLIGVQVYRFFKRELSNCGTK